MRKEEIPAEDGDILKESPNIFIDSDGKRQAPTTRKRISNEIRQKCLQLHLRQMPVTNIARALGISTRSIRGIIEQFAMESNGETDLDYERRRSIAVLQECQRQAWLSVAQQLEKKRNVSLLLAEIRGCESDIAKLQGTLYKDNSISSVAQVKNMVLEAILEICPEHAPKIAEKLRSRLLEDKDKQV